MGPSRGVGAFCLRVPGSLVGPCRPPGKLDRWELECQFSGLVGRASSSPGSDHLIPSPFEHHDRFSQRWSPTLEGFVNVGDILRGVPEDQADDGWMNLVPPEPRSFLHCTARIPAEVVKVKVVSRNSGLFAQPPPGFSELIRFPVWKQQGLIRRGPFKQRRGRGIQRQFERPPLDQCWRLRWPIPEAILAAIDIRSAGFQNEFLTNGQADGQGDGVSHPRGCESEQGVQFIRGCDSIAGLIGLQWQVFQGIGRDAAMSAGKGEISSPHIQDPADSLFRKLLLT